jgi:hypothetical protein
MCSCRNPLHAVAGSARFILDGLTPNDAIYEDMLTIVNGCLQMTGLISNVVEWTSVNADAADVDSSVTHRPVDLAVFTAAQVGERAGINVIATMSSVHELRLRLRITRATLRLSNVGRSERCASVLRLRLPYKRQCPQSCQRSFPCMSCTLRIWLPLAFRTLSRCVWNSAHAWMQAQPACQLRRV